jgi:hypothetical protein
VNYLSATIQFQAKNKVRDYAIQQGGQYAALGVFSILGNLFSKAKYKIKSINVRIQSPKNLPVRKGYSRVYRAVSEGEYQGMLKYGIFRQGSNSLEGKWFSDSLDGAKAQGKALHPSGRFRIYRSRRSRQCSQPISTS